MTICLKQVLQSQHDHGRMDQINHGKVMCNFMGGDIPKICGTHQSTTIRGIRRDAQGANLSNVKKRAGNMDNEQVSAKSKPTRGLCLLERTGGDERRRSQRRTTQATKLGDLPIDYQNKNKGQSLSSQHGDTLGKIDTSAGTSRRSID